MKRGVYRSLISGLFLVLLISMECSAQQASSFEQLQVLVRPGDNVYVTDFSGKTTKGQITDLSPSSLGFAVNGVHRNLPQTEVREISQWRGDSLANGALIGLGIGAGVVGIPTAAACGDGGSCGETVAAGLLLGGGIGAAIGAGIDALIPTKQTIFRNRNQNSLGGLQIRPIVGRSDKGVSVAFSF